MKIFQRLSSLALMATMLVSPFSAFADNQYTLQDVYDLPIMYLSPGISRTQTSGITFARPSWNGTALTIPAMSGAIFEIRQNTKRESVFASRVMVNQTTGIITLGGTVIRDLCYNQTRSFTSCNDGQLFGKSAEVRLVNSNRIYNLKMNVDRANTCTASGCLKFSGSGSLALPTFATEAERDRQYSSNPPKSRVACVDSLGTCLYYFAGSWIKFGSGSTINASSTVAGKIELATTNDILNKTVTGDTGAPLVVPTSIVTRTSTGSTQANKIPALGTNGILSGSLLGTNYSTTTATGSYFLNGLGQFAIPGGSFNFGTGADGNVTVATGATLTLSADKQYNNLTLFSGAILKPAGYRVFVKDTLVSKTNSKFQANGGAGGDGAQGAAPTGGNGGTAGAAAHGAGTLPAACDGVAGGNGGNGFNGGSATAGSAGTAGVAQTVSILGNGAVGAAGNSGNGVAGGAGGAAGAGTISTANILFNSIINSGFFSTGHTWQSYGGSGAGGGGGGGAGLNPSGGGGGGAGSGGCGGYVEALISTITGAVTFEAKGGAAGNGGAKSATGNGSGLGGKAPGGAGGIITLIYKNAASWTGTTSVVGGAASVTGSGTALAGSTGVVFTYQSK